jgi:protein-tyrosine phosphatase
MEINQILDNLHVGSCPETFEDVKTLVGRGITAVVNLQSDRDFHNHRIDWPALEAAYLAHQVDARRVPITDFDDNHLRERLPVAVRIVSELADAKHVVLVHCNVGINRSPSTVICYLHWILGWTLEEAEAHVRKSRYCSPVMEVVRLATSDWHGGATGE